MENNQIQTSQKSEGSQSLQLRKIYKGGETIMEIESNCNVSKTEFLKKTYEIQSIRDRKNEEGFDSLLAICLVKINTLGGFKGEIDDFAKQDIRKMILSQFSELSIEEVYKAFELERYGAHEVKTEHFQLFDANYISTVLKKYKNWKIDQKKILNISAPKLENEISDIQKENIVIFGINRKYSEFIELGVIDEPFVYIFDELVERGFIKLASSENSKLIEYFKTKQSEAKRELMKEYSELTSADKKERDLIKEQLSKISNNSSKKIEFRTKRIVLAEFFKKQIELGKDKIL